MKDVDIPQLIVDRMMVKCARRCCICRRFRPTKLQVHHIQERSDGGSNDEDNLIVICMSCHTDVHTKVPFARRFTHQELEAHRDALIKTVAAGTLPAIDSDDADQMAADLIQRLRRSHKGFSADELLPEAIELLVACATAGTEAEGRMMTIKNTGGMNIQSGKKRLHFSAIQMRQQATYTKALEQLEACGLIRHTNRLSMGDCYDLTYEGYLAADEFSRQ